MKVVLSGGTGYIGSEVLSQCMDNPSITSLIILTRRYPANLAANSKAKVILLEDFTVYDAPIIKELETADAAIWCLGTYNGNERIDIEYPLAFIRVIKARPPGSRPFRYVQLSGAFTEAPPKEGHPERSLWFFVNGRRVRGATEAKVLEAATDGSHGDFAVYLVKPGGVLSRRFAFLQRYIPENPFSIGISDLGATMVDLAVRGGEQRIFDNLAIIQHARNICD
ncbi:MAG: hypothetical protein Q9182_007204 [Xanthomendoza sp. 2 TL-2023]